MDGHARAAKGGLAASIAWPYHAMHSGYFYAPVGCAILGHLNGRFDQVTPGRLGEFGIVFET
jgi:hypothetical protein